MLEAGHNFTYALQRLFSAENCRTSSRHAAARWILGYKHRRRFPSPGVVKMLIQLLRFRV